ncbi:hypothetical protein V6N13_007809 [Hibiscus sabdariffa]
MFSDPGPLVRFLLICLGVHRSPCTLVYVYVVSAWLSFGLLLFVRLSPSADTWAPVPRCVICGALGASTQWLARTPSRLTGCYARALSWHSRLLRNSVVWRASSFTGVPPTKEASAPPVSTTATSFGVGYGSEIAPLSTGPPSSPVPASKCWKVKEVGDLMTGEPATEAPVNGGRNYNGPKVAKFLVGLGGRRRRPPSGGARAISEIPLWKS